jgi:uncharacterized protein
MQHPKTLHDVKRELCGITREPLEPPRDKVFEGVAPVRSGVVRIARHDREGNSCP